MRIYQDAFIKGDTTFQRCSSLRNLNNDFLKNEREKKHRKRNGIINKMCKKRRRETQNRDGKNGVNQNGAQAELSRCHHGDRLFKRLNRMI